MSKAFNKIAAGLTDAIAIAEGRADPKTYRVHVPDDIDVKAIRAKLGMTRDQFSARFGFSKGDREGLGAAPLQARGGCACPSDRD
ncbi:MAG TPA: hypothetical protein VGL66_05300 [Caulobacteraceae bacterium]|jgi:putative transcriptional regulator